VSYHFSFYTNSLSPCTPIVLSIYLSQLFGFLYSCRHYILDLMRVTPRDSNYMGLEHRFCVLRPELVASFVEVSSSHTLLTLLSSCCMVSFVEIIIVFYLYLRRLNRPNKPLGRKFQMLRKNPMTKLRVLLMLRFVLISSSVFLLFAQKRYT
jgi:hypothetical protein